MCPSRFDIGVVCTPKAAPLSPPPSRRPPPPVLYGCKPRETVALQPLASLRPPPPLFLASLHFPIDHECNPAPPTTVYLCTWLRLHFVNLVHVTPPHTARTRCLKASATNTNPWPSNMTRRHDAESAPAGGCDRQARIHRGPLRAMPQRAVGHGASVPPALTEFLLAVPSGCVGILAWPFLVR